MRIGKLPLDTTAGLLARLPAKDPRVIVGPRVGEDAAAIAFGQSAIIAGMDPITFATDLIGWYAVQVNANDIAVMGARPCWFLGALLLPPGSSEQMVLTIFEQLSQACRELDIVPVGGHTEVTPAVNQPVIVGCMLGEVARERIVVTGGARPGDVVVLCGAAGLEGTAVLAREADELLAGSGFQHVSIEEAKRFLFEPGISVVRPALAAASAGVTGMHDPTEGGIASGLLEIARASEVGLEVEMDQIPVLPLTREICGRLQLDPLGLIASGALLITARAEKAAAVLEALRGEGAAPTVIGRVLPAGDGLWAIEGGVRRPLPVFERDEVARFLERMG